MLVICIFRASYFPVTAHWITSEWETAYVLLDFIDVRERHTAENISTRLFGIFCEFNIQDKILATVTDGAPNMKASCGKKGKLLQKLCDERMLKKKGNQGR